MKLLALDQSSRVSGYAIFENGELVKQGTFSAEDSDLGVRLEWIRSRVAKLINDNAIDEVMLEDIQMQANVANNVVTFKTLAEVFGVLYELCIELDKPVNAVLSTVWKSKLGIKGRDRLTQKKAAATYVQNTFGIHAAQDACDAICIGAYVMGDALKTDNFATQDYNWK